MPTVGTAEAAEMLGLSQPRVVQLINEGELDAQKIGKTWILDTADVKAFAKRDRPGPGRPPSDPDE